MSKVFVMSNVNIDLLAKLLATEDISVVHSNVKTATFDTRNRILTLPIFKEGLFSRNVTDMFIGHEVGHALFTPIETDADINARKDIPHAIVNIVEDARIERLIKRRYAGLARIFNKAYTEIHEDADFFGLRENNIDVGSLSFPDRINLSAKLGAMFLVPFSDKELVVKKLVDDAETFDDVIFAARAVNEL